MIAVADAIHLPLADQSVDLVFGSPPYTDCRDYGIGAGRNTAAWVSWMLKVTTECLRVSRGAVVWVAAGPTRDRNYQPACEGLMWLWYMRGGSMYRPCYWNRVGVPGSGGDQWFRHDTEQVMCFKRPGPLPWTNNTAMGHPPVYGPGGEMSYRTSDGSRVNQWGHSADSGGTATLEDGRHRSKGARPSHRTHTKGELGSKGFHRRKRQANGEMEEQDYAPPVLANPGTLVQTKTGGGHLGSKLAHENEAPFPEKLAEWFVLSLCPEGGTVLDPFAGSGTTMAVTIAHGRKAVATDVRMSQAKLARRRTAQVQRRLL